MNCCACLIRVRCRGLNGAGAEGWLKQQLRVMEMKLCSSCDFVAYLNNLFAYSTHTHTLSCNVSFPTLFSFTPEWIERHWWKASNQYFCITSRSNDYMLSEWRYRQLSFFSWVPLSSMEDVCILSFPECLVETKTEWESRLNSFVIHHA